MFSKDKIEDAVLEVFRPPIDGSSAACDNTERRPELEFDEVVFLGITIAWLTSVQ